VDNLFDDILNISDNLLHKKTFEYERFLLDELLEIQSKVVGIYGSRGVGKTTLLYQLAKKLPCKDDEILYLSCDYPYLSEVSLFKVVEHFQKYGIKCFLIDEIHEAKDFQKELKLIYDVFDVRVFFSGSSAIKITDASFARRYVLKKLPILSFREFCELKLGIQLESYSLEDIVADHRNIANAVLKDLGQKVLKLFKEYLKAGAYPFYFEERENVLSKLNGSINATLYNDIAIVYNVSPAKIATLKKLMLNICTSKPFELSMESLSKISGIAKATLYKYLDYLHRAELVTHITYEAKRFKNMQKPDKLYLANPTLFNIFCQNSDIGTIRESFFVSQVISFYSIYYANKGDFLVDEKYTFEIGGAKKSFDQIKDVENAFVVADDIEIGFGNKIPLWLFGLMY
jgi:predicted AAA+ superfamily ATPase